ncbi:Hypothetical predicted protein [Pelobates cultripes]|uniref:CWH43-like N-terminal domain-containing protein n=1 Tax=Pelobates cultripes TaxID=61616 RepID=A0AAD1W0Z7_PELCU|nr:Hypothetical predicted protein [Pelobates cultripes]
MCQTILKLADTWSRSIFPLQIACHCDQSYYVSAYWLTHVTTGRIPLQIAWGACLATQAPSLWPITVICRSDGGVHYPESRVFTVVLTVSANWGFFTVYIMFRLMQLRSQTSDTSSSCLNKILLVLGWLWCLGILIVGCFQLHTYVVIHLIGGALAYMSGTMYIFCLTFIEKNNNQVISNTMCLLRMGLSVYSLLLMLLLFSCVIYGLVKGEIGNPTVENIHLAGAVFEWLTTFGLFSFLLTLIPDFQQITIKRPEDWRDNWFVMRETMQTMEEFP